MGILTSLSVRQTRNEALVREAGADEVIVGDDLEPAHAYGPYDLIIESLFVQNNALSIDTSKAFGLLYHLLLLSLCFGGQWPVLALLAFGV